MKNRFLKTKVLIPLSSRLFPLIIAAITLIGAIFTSCKSKGSADDVYVAGYVLNKQGISVATLWKNGKAQSLTDGTLSAYAYSVFVSDGDVYVAGDDGVAATVWKNGVAQRLSDGTRTARAHSVFVSGNDVYAVGWHDWGQYGWATLWKNGVTQRLSDRIIDGNDGVSANSVFVSGNDVYVVGDDGFIATLWKNGVARTFENSETYSSSIFISGSDIYIAGYTNFGDGDWMIATLWKNGVAQYLTDKSNYSIAHSVYVSDNDVYVIGYTRIDNGMAATLWKNGISQTLTDETKTGMAHSVFVLNSDVYVAGYEYSEHGYAAAILWKNGVPQRLTDGKNYSTAHSVFVVSRSKTATENNNNVENIAKANETETETSSSEFFPENNVSVTDVDILTPTTIDEFKRLMTPAEAEVEGGAYDYKDDPNGSYYHFWGYVSGGNTSWDGMYYEEEFGVSSVLSPQGNNSYGAENLQNNRNYGGDRSFTWCEGVNGHGIGERVNMRIRTQGFYSEDGIGLFEVMIVNGYAKNQTVWKNNSRVKILRLYVGDKHWCDLHLMDIMKPQIFRFPEHLLIEPHKVGKKIEIPEEFVQTEWIKSVPYQTDLTFEIIEVYPGDKFEDTCITGIAINGYSNLSGT